MFRPKDCKGLEWNEGVTTTKLAISDNLIVNCWGADVFAHATAIDVSTSATEHTIELVNNTGATANFEGTSCISVCLLAEDVVGPVDADGAIDASQVTTEVLSVEIHTIQ